MAVPSLPRHSNDWGLYSDMMREAFGGVTPGGPKCHKSWDIYFPFLEEYKILHVADSLLDVQGKGHRNKLRNKEILKT